MNKIILFCIAAIVPFFIGVSIYAYPYVDDVDVVGGKLLFLQERTTPEEWQQGLSGRSGLCAYCGMIFLFPEADLRGFWMKDMRFPIDIIWLQDGKVVHIEEHVSHETPEKVYKPNIKVDTVLELPAGGVAQRGIVIGSHLSF